ncbi:hypothetical protein GCK32_006235, partial [Trichostrongylus colubriformis]
MNLTLRSQVEADVIDLTVEKEKLDSDGDVVCLEDLTLIDEDDITILTHEQHHVNTEFQTDKTDKCKRRSKKRMSLRLS